METITISKKKYQELKAAKARLDALSNVQQGKKVSRGPQKSFADLVGALSDVKGTTRKNIIRGTAHDH